MTKESKVHFVEASTPKAFFDLIKETYALHDGLGNNFESEKKDREDSRETDLTKR